MKSSKRAGIFAIVMWIVTLNAVDRIAELWATDNGLHHAWRVAAAASMLTLAIMFTVEWRSSRLASVSR